MDEVNLVVQLGNRWAAVRLTPERSAVLAVAESPEGARAVADASRGRAMARRWAAEREELQRPMRRLLANRREAAEVLRATGRAVPPELEQSIERMAAHLARSCRP